LVSKHLGTAMRPGQCAGGRSPPDLSNPRWIEVCAVLGVAEEIFVRVLERNVFYLALMTR
jgi:hypothetical protein